MSITAGIAAIKSGFDVAKSIRELVKQEKIDANEVSSQLLLLQQIMLDTQAALNEAAEEQRNLQAQLDRTRELEADKLWEPDGSFYRRKSDQESGHFIPYCPTCWNSEHKSIPMAPYGQQPGVYKCALHETMYRTRKNDEFNQEQDRRMREMNQCRTPGPWG